MFLHYFCGFWNDQEYCALVVFSNQTSFQFKYNILDQQARRMSERKQLLTPKAELKSSIKKHLEPHLLSKNNASKAKPLDSEQDAGLTEKTNLAAQAAQSEQKLLSNRSKKREKLAQKNQEVFQRQMEEAEKSERCAKIMGSFDKPTNIKENHLNVLSSNKREFSESRDPEDKLSVSKKKVTTESKKSKPVQSSSKHSKTEIKNDDKASIAATEIREEKALNTVEEIANEACNERVEEKPERVEEKPERAEEQPEAAEEQTKEESPQPEPVGVKKSMRKAASKSKDSKVGQDKKTEVARDTKMSKNLKRSEVSKSEQELEDEKAKMKKSKSVKHGLRSENKSKDSKVNGVKSGGKKQKLNERQRWH